MWQSIYNVSILIVDLAILFYVRAEYLSSVHLDEKLSERLKKRKAIAKEIVKAEFPNDHRTPPINVV